MNTLNTLGLSEEEYQELTDILKFVLPDARIEVFGSRAQGTHKKHSDIDLLIDMGQAIDLKLLGKARGFLSASNLPMRVDLVDATTISDEFREVVGKRVLLQEKEA